MIKYPASMWYGMKARCKPGAQQVNRPNYKGCVIGFADIDEFKEWAAIQPGYDCYDENGRRYHLDKDLIHPGNKIYAPEFCSLVPARINTLMLDCGSKECTGVSFHKATGKWQARVQTNEGREYLGVYETAEIARFAWRVKKAHAIRMAMAWYQEKEGFDVRVYESLISQARVLEEVSTCAPQI